MTRGNQREIDRKRSEARKASGPKKGMEGSMVDRKERDRLAVLEKQKAFDDRKKKEEEDAAAKLKK
ncbi:hypothetical protein PPL_05537 [Heterostelium album PN500]|uniref:Small EDRK-rich factor-like N-terminal domain-containing protein n=1 Tax=Heterostelium pallidum (strain ATCC 26659 / Pp 5 / PN500) TaxID=670386 RepID=D3BAG1_HETP5|nr:hypothetical protein PPL_05537 [Heterostelium album PN500]EFA81548.1 hypothetical protein PPL_05537 [Heterostelium album PN500]|eukprot:XP_020433665.1 hypothetical protein PPL_05537 [Heterostelium album PN500]